MIVIACVYVLRVMGIGISTVDRWNGVGWRCEGSCGFAFKPSETKALHTLGNPVCIRLDRNHLRVWIVSVTRLFDLFGKDPEVIGIEEDFCPARILDFSAQ